MRTEQSSHLFERASQLMPGGVNSPVRAFRSVGGTPRFLVRGAGSRVWDEDGNEYLDFVMSWGPLILGHAHPRVVAAVVEAAPRGLTFGAPTAREVRLAELVQEAFPSLERLRLVNSGTEATMSAVRLARAFTGRDRIVKFDGCWHGHADSLLVRAGSSGLQYGAPDSAGVTAACAADTLVARYNDLPSVNALLQAHPGQVAAIIVEPVAGNMGVVPPAPGFLAGLRELTDRHGALLIFDEVITGFRVAAGGAQELYGVTPDLTTLGKILGGGLPVGAYGGRREIMELVSPLGPMVQAGTLAGNPLATSAGIATLTFLRRPGLYEELERKSALLETGLRAAATATGVPVTINRVGSMLTAFFTSHPVTNADDLRHVNRDRYARFFHGLLDRGVALAPSYCEAAFLSTEHSDRDLELAAEAAAEALAELPEVSP
ncbi:MAG TPA: glutamate-1-semialdehyde 2,1-aminomutase [Armatimonadota bacterium]|jgi:glutamate-1-semialdehyde 2,1-aminomutase